MANPNLVLVDRAQLDKLLGEMELSLSGMVSPANAKPTPSEPSKPQ